jgi:hypothetical protein
VVDGARRRVPDPVVPERLPRLRKLAGAKIADLVALAERPGTPAIEELAEIELANDDLPLWKRLCKVGALAKLRALGICVEYDSQQDGTTPKTFAWLFDSKLGKQLERISIDSRWTPIAPYLAMFQSRPRLRELELRTTSKMYDQLRDRLTVIAKRTDGPLALELHIHDRQEMTSTGLVECFLEGLPAKQTAKQLRVVVGPAPTKKTLENLRDLLARDLKGFSEIDVTGRD